MSFLVLATSPARQHCFSAFRSDSIAMSTLLPSSCKGCHTYMDFFIQLKLLFFRCGGNSPAVRRVGIPITIQRYTTFTNYQVAKNSKCMSPADRNMDEMKWRRRLRSTAWHRRNPRPEAVAVPRHRIRRRRRRGGCPNTGHQAGGRAGPATRRDPVLGARVCAKVLASSSPPFFRVATVCGGAVI